MVLISGCNLNSCQAALFQHCELVWLVGLGFSEGGCGFLGLVFLWSVLHQVYGFKMAFTGSFLSCCSCSINAQGASEGVSVLKDLSCQ